MHMLHRKHRNHLLLLLLLPLRYLLLRQPRAGRSALSASTATRKTRRKSEDRMMCGAMSTRRKGTALSRGGDMVIWGCDMSRGVKIWGHGIDVVGFCFLVLWSSGNVDTLER
ncbi:hypothetical protein EDC01DRAFT_676949 [Geopyxis carbonaria]|nr:hypothetical protein EDC01DRAFT_676949 [Geopyxis carbonaria]